MDFAERDDISQTLSRLTIANVAKHGQTNGQNADGARDLAELIEHTKVVANPRSLGELASEQKDLLAHALSHIAVAVQGGGFFDLEIFNIRIRSCDMIGELMTIVNESLVQKRIFATIQTYNQTIEIPRTIVDKNLLQLPKLYFAEFELLYFDDFDARINSANQQMSRGSDGLGLFAFLTLKENDELQIELSII